MTQRRQGRGSGGPGGGPLTEGSGAWVLDLGASLHCREGRLLRPRNSAPLSAGGAARPATGAAGPETPIARIIAMAASCGASSAKVDTLAMVRIVDGTPHFEVACPLGQAVDSRPPSERPPQETPLCRGARTCADDDRSTALGGLGDRLATCGAARLWRAMAASREARISAMSASRTVPCRTSYVPPGAPRARRATAPTRGSSNPAERSYDHGAIHLRPRAGDACSRGGTGPVAEPNALNRLLGRTS